MTDTGIAVPASVPAVTSAGLLVRAVCAALAAAALTAAVGAVAAWAGVPMAAGSVGAADRADVTAASFLMGTAICTFWGTVLAFALRRWARRPRRAFVRVTVGLAVLSLAAPVLANAEPATKVVLALAHVVAALVIIPLVASGLPGERRP
ncbi:DUF6069 family protein [Asanoa sp. WMMD1127]|uniref:DUF6069 family protein n=1 Tax=Asanoa sp. WMMD1127 TaxID=3016107 RepID=UPI002416E56B|nr:DUF6069 family protein [Asanoa sp. WMMD1127]MDG4821688.1 DUF6069 family protein [Asanoa sp. WMMD1127]